MRNELAMGGGGLIGAVCLLGALAAVACGSSDDSSPGSGGASAGSSGKGNGKAGGSNVGGADSENAGAGGAAGDTGQSGGNVGVGGGTGGTSGTGGACSDFTVFVHSVIKDDTTEKSAPRAVNGVVFCTDPADPAAYNDLF